MGWLSYLNTVPFYTALDFEKVPAPNPRALTRFAIHDKIDAGPVSLVDSWKLVTIFEPVKDFGISVYKQAKSVILFARKPLVDLPHMKIGVTDETATSVHLLNVLLTNKFQIKMHLHEGSAEDDDAQLLIGDKALKMSKEESIQFPFKIDLAEEWYKWKNLPFVFARWMVKKSINPSLKKRLADQLENSLIHYENNMQSMAETQSMQTGFHPREVADYLNCFSYRLDHNAKIAEKVFNAMIIESLSK